MYLFKIIIMSITHSTSNSNQEVKPHKKSVLEGGNNMIWLQPSDYKNQEYITLRLYAPKDEKILLTFNPLKISTEPDWKPAYEEWHCYSTPLLIYMQDYELLLDYFNKIYPIIDEYNKTLEPAFDICFYNWIGKDDWFKIISEIEQDLEHISDYEKPFFIAFLEWLKEALNHTSIIVVEGNL